MSKHTHSHSNHEHSPACDHESVFDEIYAKLAASTYKLTKTRVSLLEVIAQAHGPFTADSLFEKMKANRDAACDLVTIYRTLVTFEELEIIERCDFSDEKASYEVMVGDRKHHHHHIVCTNCKKVEPLDHCLVESQEQLLKQLGYKNLKHKLEFSGLCPDCSGR